MTERAMCYVNRAALKVYRDSQLYLNLKRWGKNVLRKCYGGKHCFANAVTGGVAIS